MITNTRNVYLFTGELTNDQYHDNELIKTTCDTEINPSDYTSGSELFTVVDDCPYAYKYAEKEETQSLAFGTTAHTALLEPDKFNEQYYRIPHKDDFEDCLSSDAAMKSLLKEFGVKGYTALKGNDLIAMVKQCEPNAVILKDQIQRAADLNHGKEGVGSKDYDLAMKMRKMLHHVYGSRFINSQHEISIFAEIEIDGDWYKVKVRLDCLTDKGVVIDYKSTQTAKPSEFGRHANRLGYWVKMALQYDLAVAANLTNELPRLLAQGKKSPFIPQEYELTEDQIESGRNSYITGLKLINSCEQNGYFAYGSETQDLPAEDWMF